MHVRRLEDLCRGQHACLVYEPEQPVVPLVAPYLRAGLEVGERCVYVLGDHRAEDVRAALAEAGVAVAAEIARGALVLVDRWEVSFPGGVFDPAAMTAYVRAQIAAAIDAGFTGVRLAAEMTWAFQLGVDHQRLIHYEALGNHLYPDEPLVAVCLYDRSRFPAEVCRDALRVHPVVAVGSETFPNLYYEPPEVAVGGMGAQERVDWMIAQLRRLREVEARRLELSEVRQAAAEAEAALRAREEILSLLAHELRAPLRHTLACARIVARELERMPEVAPAVRTSLAMVDRQARKQGKLIQHILDAARSDRQELPLEARAFDLTALAREVVELTREWAGSHDIALLGSGGPVEVVADPARLEQVLSNLVDNALKFSGAGSRVEVSVERVEAGVELAVRDWGPGVAVDERERIFDRYHRASGGFTGLGLGLHISRVIVRRHGGDIEVEHPEDGGSRFVVRLPRDAPVDVAQA